MTWLDGSPRGTDYGAAASVPAPELVRSRQPRPRGQVSALINDPPRVLVVGSGFAGFHALKALERRLPAGAADLTLVSPTDYLLYSPLLPEVATGVIEPRHIAIALRQKLRKTHLVIGRVTGADLQRHTATIRPGGTVGGSSPREPVEIGWDRLILVPGSVSRMFDIPGLEEHARGVKTLQEALYLRDHLVDQLDQADGLPASDEFSDERRERLTVVAVGAGYTGTELVAQLQRWVKSIAERWVGIGADDVRWVLVDAASAVLPELGPELGARALSTLRSRGVEVRLGVSVKSVSAGAVELTDGSIIGTRTLIWGAGVVASPLVSALDLPTIKGRLVVDDCLRVPGHENVWAAGDAAAVPDTAVSKNAVTPPTAQHAQRQGVALARNVAASLGHGHARPYRHRNLGLVADLGGSDAVARPFGVSLSGPVAKVMTRAYHIYSLPTVGNKSRVAADWLFEALLPTQVVRLTAIRDSDALIAAAQATTLD